MNRVAKFFPVSLKQFINDFRAQGKGYDWNEEDIAEVHSQIQLPTRATAGSAGYDFFSPADFTLKPGETALIATGVKCRIEEGWFLGIYPRSGLGFNYRAQLDNTVGIIDADYFNCEKNEGHIMIKLTNDSKTGKVLEIKAGQAIAQGIFQMFGIVEDDSAEGTRTGGFNSTNR